MTKDRPAGAVWLIPLALLAAAAPRIAGLLRPPDFMIDAAMLYLGLDATPRILPWTPLALYEQSAPWLVELLFKAMIGAVGLNEALLLVPVALASLAALVVMGLAGRRLMGTLGVALAILVAGFADEVLYHSLFLKQYAFEFLASTLILAAALPLRADPSRLKPLLVFAGVSLAMSPLSFTAPLASVGVAAAIGLEALVEKRLTWRGLIAPAAVGAAWAALVVAWQVLAVAPATALQFSGYASVYSGGFLALDEPRTFVRFARTMLRILQPELGPDGLRDTVAVGYWAIYALGALIAWRRCFFLYALPPILVGLFAALSALGLLPVSMERHFAFAVPLLALPIGRAVFDIVEWASARIRTVRTVAVAVVAAWAAALALGACLHVADYDAEPMGRVLPRTTATRCPAMWVYYGAQPAFELYSGRLDPGILILGRVDARSHPEGWVSGARGNYPRYAEASRRVIAAEPRVCLLLSHPWPGDHRPILERVAETHRCGTLVSAGGTTILACERRP